MPEATPWHKPGVYYVAPGNFDPKVMAERPYLPKRVYIKDDTLREGEETPGVVFTMEDRLEIAQHLQDAGVAEIEMFRPHSLEATREMNAAFNRAGLTIGQSFVGGGFTGWIEWLDMIAEGGGKSVTLLSGWPEDEIWSPGRLTAPREELYGRITEAIQHGKKLGLHVCFGAPNTTRVQIHNIVNMYTMATKAGADRLHIYDTFGLGVPTFIRFMVSRVKEAVGDTPILFHGHNDMGQAVANTVGAIEGGATWCDVVVNGLGDRAGNASLEEVVCILEVLFGIDTGIKLEKLYELSQFIERKSGIKLQPHKAIVGKHAFLEESHFMGRKATQDAGHPEVNLPFISDLVGQIPSTVIGSTNLYIGALEYLLDQWGMPSDAEVVEAIRNQVKARIAGGGYLEEEQVHQIAKDVLGK